jgi:ATP-binding cassette subfamily B protein AbcA/BmrA
MLTLALVLLIPMIFIVILPISRKVNLISERQQKIIGKSNGYFSETIAQLRLIKSYGTERFESERGKSEIDEIYNLGKNNAKVISVLTPLLGTVMTILFLTVIGIGAYNVSRGTLTSGALVAFFLYFFEVINPIQSLANFFVEIQEFEGRTKELFQFIENELENLESGRTPKELGSIQFSNVSFKYKHKDKQALSNVSFTIQHGKKTSIVGASGSGKTTIISLLEQFYIPQSGSITLESTPIHIFSLKKWRNMFSYVSQDSKIITGTIKENILYGTSGTVSDAELTEISKIANIYEYISQLPEKFDTWVGERGILLSGGQRQRISIARALIKNSEYLLLDEATSNLDYDSEEKIQKSIKYLQNGKTSVMIAHKLSSVIDSDNIIVLEDGKVTGVGTHWELINTNTYYNKWANMQIGNKYALT